MQLSVCFLRSELSRTTRLVGPAPTKSNHREHTEDYVNAYWSMVNGSFPKSFDKIIEISVLNFLDNFRKKTIISTLLRKKRRKD